MDFDITPDLAEICGIHTGDGYLRNDGRRKELDISGGIEEKEYYDNHVIPLFNRVFDLNIKGRFFPHRNTYGFVIRDEKIIKFIRFLGFPYGAKSLTVKIPSFIFFSETLMKKFLRGYFDTDGCFTCQKRLKGKYSIYKKTFHYYPTLGTTTVSEYLYSDVKKLLEKLGFLYYTYEYEPKKQRENKTYSLILNGPSRTVKFFQEINPKNTSKTSRYRIWEKFGFCPTKTTFKQRCKILKGELDILGFYGKRARSIMDLLTNAP